MPSAAGAFLNSAPTSCIFSLCVCVYCLIVILYRDPARCFSLLDGLLTRWSSCGRTFRTQLLRQKRASRSCWPKFFYSIEQMAMMVPYRMATDEEKMRTRDKCTDDLHPFYLDEDILEGGQDKPVQRRWWLAPASCVSLANSCGIRRMRIAIWLAAHRALTRTRWKKMARPVNCYCRRASATSFLRLARNRRR